MTGRLVPAIGTNRASRGGPVAAVAGGYRALAQVAPGDLYIPILGQLAPAQLPLGDALEPGPLEVVGLDAPLGVGRSGSRR
jgi:hypothetical protein